MMFIDTVTETLTQPCTSPFKLSVLKAGWYLFIAQVQPVAPKQTCFKAEPLQFAGFHVESVLGREVGPLAVYVRALGGTPVLRMSLEEVDL